MAVPIITKEKIVDYLRLRAPQNPIVEVSGIYPSTDDIVAYGVYIDDVTTMSREPYKLGVQYSGAIYTESDQFNILYVSFQNDPQSIQMQFAIEDMAANVNFFDGYHEVDFTRDIVIGNRSEKHTYTFDIKRIEFNNPSQI